MTEQRDDDAPTVLAYPRTVFEYDECGDREPDDCESWDATGEWCSDACENWPWSWAHAPFNVGDDVSADPDPYSDYDDAF